MEHLLAQLETGNPAVSQRIVNLLFNSYMPVEKDAQVQVTRVVRLLQTNQAAARNFFAHAYKHMSTSVTGSPMPCLLKFLKHLS